MVDAEIESLIGRFEDCTLPKSEWTHGAHLVMALWYQVHHGRDEATRLIRDGIQRYNESLGNRTGYHETITLAWIAVIERFLGGRPGATPISVLAAELLENCGDKDFLLRFYTRERLFCAEARSRGCRRTGHRSRRISPVWAAHCVADTEPIGLPRMAIPSGRGRPATLKPRAISSARRRR